MNGLPRGFAKPIQALRKRMGMSQQDLAHKLGRALSTVAQWEQGKAIPRGDFVMLMIRMSREMEAPLTVKEEIFDLFIKAAHARGTEEEPSSQLSPAGPREVPSSSDLGSKE